ncbi:alkaline phosphatase family protein [Jatrophihabitans sp. DSM 45814]
MVIDHVVVLCLENRSFDHMLGYLDHPSPDFEGLLGSYDNPGWDGGPRVAASPDAKKVLPFGPDHSHDAVMEQLSVNRSGPEWRPTNQGFVTSYERKARGLAPPRMSGIFAPILNRLSALKVKSQATGSGRGPLAMLCQPMQNVPVLSRLALDFAVCDHWFCSVPGETWPNRNYLHAATSDGETDIEPRPYLNPTIFELLEEHGHTWHIYHDDTPQVWAFPKLWDTPERHAKWYPSNRFAEHVAAGQLAAYSFIEPNHRPPFHTLDHQPLLGEGPDVSTSQHPENNLVSNAAYDEFDPATDTDFARGESLIANVYEALRGNPDLFARTLLVITYDEHGGLFDHVPPPDGVPAPGDGRSGLGRLLHALWHRSVHPFDFTLLGPRVPTVLVSPLIPAGTLVSRIHDHASVPSTLRALFAPDASPLTARDAWSPPFHDVASLAEPRTDLPDLSAYLPAVPLVSAASNAGSRAARTTSVADAARPVPLAAPVPTHYQPFVAQAEKVRAHLVAINEPEAGAVNATSDSVRASQITAAFSDAAHRHRHPDEVHP